MRNPNTVEARTDLSLFREIPLFSNLSDETLSTLIEQIDLREMGVGERLVEQGEKADCFFILLSGWVKLTKRAGDGEESVISIFSHGQSFGEAAALELGWFPVSAEVVEPALVGVLRADMFRSLLAKDNSLAASIIAALSSRLHRLTQAQHSLLCHNAVQRVGNFLCEFCDGDTGSVTIRLPFDRGLISQKLGMSRETLSRGLRDLRNIGVRSSGKTIRIEDIGTLRKFVDQAPAKEAQWPEI